MFVVGVVEQNKLLSCNHGLFLQLAVIHRENDN